MTLSPADFADTNAHYAYQCATCAARYIVNIRPNEGDGGLLPNYGTRRTPHGADEARAMALNCCHDNPEPANGQNVYWSASHVVGSPAHLHLGNAGDAGEPVVEPRREYRECAVEVVKPGNSEVWTRGEQMFNLSGPGLIYEHPYDCRGFRLDFMPDESPEGRRREWAKLLMSMTLDIYINYAVISRGLTFAPVRCTDCEHSKFLDRMKDRDPARMEDRPDDAPLFHANVRWTVLDGFDIRVSPHMDFRVQIRYESVEPLPIAFMRLVALGYELHA